MNRAERARRREERNRWPRKWPVPVGCYGRRYLANNMDQLNELVGFLVRGELMAANLYRIGGSWPRRHERG